MIETAGATPYQEDLPPVRPMVRAFHVHIGQCQPAAFKNACVVCHDDDVIRQQRLPRAQWDREINKMTGWGAQVKGEDRDGFLDYLFSNYGPRPRGR